MKVIHFHINHYVCFQKILNGNMFVCIYSYLIRALSRLANYYFKTKPAFNIVMNNKLIILYETKIDYHKEGSLLFKLIFVKQGINKIEWQKISHKSLKCLLVNNTEMKHVYSEQSDCYHLHSCGLHNGVRIYELL